MDLTFHQCLAIYITLFMISLIFFLTRCYVRVKINKEMNTEDWFAVAAIVLMFVETVLSVLFTKDFLLVTNPQKLFTIIKMTEFPQFLKHMLQIQIGSYVSFMTSLYCIKFSFLFFYKRIAAGMKLSKFWVFTLVICTLAYIGNFIGFFFSCVPFSTYFDASCNTQTSRNNASLYGFTSTDILTDVLIMIIPIRLLGHLRVSKNQKIGLAFLFSLGLTVVAMSIVRTLRIEAGNASPTLDPKWVAVWSMAEQTTAMVVNCLPAIRKLFSVEAEKHGLKFPTAKGFNPTSFPKWSFLTRHSNDSAEKNQIHKETQVNFWDAIVPIGTALRSPSDLEAGVLPHTSNHYSQHGLPQPPSPMLPENELSSQKVSARGQGGPTFVSKMLGSSASQEDLESQMSSTEEFSSHGEAMLRGRAQSSITVSTNEGTKSI